MKVIVLDNYEAVCQKAAKLIEEEVQENANAVLGLPTGATPIGLYKRLVKGFKTRGISYENVKTVNLDEYLGLSKNHPQSYHKFMVEKLFKHINISSENTFIPNGRPLSTEKECARFEEIIGEIGPINLQVLGIGTNGHIGFNEPGTDPTNKTHVVRLNEITRKNNAKYFQSESEVPTHAITLGIQTIMSSVKIILLASGKNKAQAVKRLLGKEINVDFPASYLWRHNNVTLIVDKAAYQLVKEVEVS